MLKIINKLNKITKVLTFVLEYKKIKSDLKKVKQDKNLYSIRLFVLKILYINC